MSAIEIGLPKELEARYSDARPLGRGGMGAVFKVFDKKVQRVVALKLLSLNPLIDANSYDAYVERFKREWRLLASIKSPDVVDLYDCGLVKGIPYLTMEYVEGLPLSEIIEEAPLSVEEALKFAIQIGRALSHVHEAGILHRDIKPQNVMVTDSGRYKLLDFGLAAVFDGDTLTRLTETGVVIGTLLYIPPEYFQNGHYDVHGEVYEFGAVLYEALTGKLHIPSENVNNVVAYALGGLTEPIETPSFYNRKVPAQLDALVMASISRLPENRPSSMIEFVKVCELCLQNLEEVEPPIGHETEVLSKPIVKLSTDLPETGPNRVPLIASASILLFFIVALLFSGRSKKNLSASWQKSLVVECKPRSLTIKWQTDCGRNFRYAIRRADQSNGTPLQEGRQKGFSQSHHLVFRPLEPQCAYEISIEDEGGKVIKTASTVPISLEKNYFISSLDGVVFAHCPVNSPEGVSLAVTDGKSVIRANLKDDNEPIVLSGLTKARGAPFEWKLLYGEKTIAQGRVHREPVSLPSPIAVPVVDDYGRAEYIAPLGPPLWFGQSLLWVDCAGYINCCQLRGRPVHSWFYRPPHILKPPKFFASVGVFKLADDELLAISRYEDFHSFQFEGLSPSHRASLWERKKRKEIVPSWSSNENSWWYKERGPKEWRKTVVQYRRNITLMGQLCQFEDHLCFVSNFSRGKAIGVHSAKIGHWEIEPKYSRLFESRALLEGVPGTYLGDTAMAGAHLLITARPHQRNKEGSLSWGALAVPVNDRGRLLKKLFTSRNNSIRPLPTDDGTGFYLAGDRNVWYFNCLGEGKIEEIELPPSLHEKEGFLSAAVLRRGSLLYLIRFEQMKKDFVAYGIGTALRGHLLTYDLNTKKLVRFFPPLIDEETSNSDGGAIWLHHTGRYLYGFSGRSVFVYDEKAKRGASWQPTRETERILTGSLGPGDNLAILTFGGELFVVPPTLLLAARGQTIRPIGN